MSNENQTHIQSPSPATKIRVASQRNVTLSEDVKPSPESQLITSEWVLRFISFGTTVFRNTSTSVSPALKKKKTPSSGVVFQS